MFPTNPATPGAFSGLDDAQVGLTKLASGTTLVEIVKCEVENGQFGLTFHAHVVVVQSDNPLNKPGDKRRWTRGGLTKNQWEESNRGRLKQFLAALFGMDPTQPPAPGHTWDAVASQAVDGEGTALAGRRLILQGEDAASANGSYVKWKCFPAPAPAPTA